MQDALRRGLAGLDVSRLHGGGEGGDVLGVQLQGGHLLPQMHLQRVADVRLQHLSHQQLSWELLTLPGLLWRKVTMTKNKRAMGQR